MRTSRRAVVLGFLVAVCAPVAASAAPILIGGGGRSDCTFGSTTLANCSRFELQAVLSGEFSSDRDIALFEFTLAEDALFTATTTSYLADGGFDPSLSLFHGDDRAGHRFGQIVTYPDPDGSPASFPARGTDIDETNYDDRLALMLGQGSYLLALVKFPNGATLDESIGLDSLLAGFECDATESCEGAVGTNAFSLSVSTTPVDGGPEPVPEPATLTLMAGGALAGLIQRHRAKRRARRVPVSR
jgi:hypothetical protein